MTNNEPEVYNYKAYLRGKYIAERYNTEQEIANAITGGKVFLFRSTFGLLASTWGFFVLGCCYIAWAIWATIDTGLWIYLGDLFTPAGAWLWILWGLALVFFLLARSQFVIVGPRGIVWREWGTLQALPWQKVALRKRSEG